MSESESSKRTVWIVIAIVVAGILIALAILLTQCAGDDASDSEAQEKEDTPAAVVETGTVVADSGDEGAASDEGDEPDEPASESPWDAETGQFDGRISIIRMESGTYVIEIDYVQIMSREDAIAQGHESPANAEEPPDYRVVNETVRYRTWPVAPGAQALDEHVEYESDYWDDFVAGGGTPDTPLVLSFDEFVTGLWTPHDGYQGAIYTIELVDGEVQSVRHLFFP